ncbi:right-handed parallel beta-helix repeat-containing protein, partial [Micromonospora yasonensis]|nr:right-handed parallel beta-helix repeat-containing protein [Micromonospora yasonensis]
AAADVVLDGNEIWENGLDGIRIDRPMTDATVVNNRIRNNGRRCAPATSGAGESVRYGHRKMVDSAAHWPSDGHRGKVVRVGSRTAVVVANTDTELRLAEVRPDSVTGWNEDTPPPGTRYELPDRPPIRAGITVNAPFDSASVRANRIWDHRDDQTQTYGLWVTGQGSCVSCRVEDNDFADNAAGAVRLDTPPVGGHWQRNHQENG